MGRFKAEFDVLEQMYVLILKLQAARYFLPTPMKETVERCHICIGVNCCSARVSVFTLWQVFPL